MPEVLEVVEVSRNEMESGELVEREQRIERAQRNAYLEIGLELKAIRDRRGYKVQREKPIQGRLSFTTFEEYCEQRWEMDKRRVNQLIESAEAVTEMGKIFPILPARESHVRALLALEDEKQRADVWKRVVDSGESITAARISQEVSLYKSERDKNWLTLDEYTALTEQGRRQALQVQPYHKATFNEQDTDSIEWARYSWNPVTGCKHECNYCYARDIANRFFPQKFDPSIIPPRLSAPLNTPQKNTSGMGQADSMGYKNVFTCSMADLWGKWVPREWIEAVLEQVHANPQWNFLFLTKFPERYAEFEFPDNAWVGTSVDRQSAVARAEKAMANVKARFKWLSCEPMMERLTFSNLGIFQWLVVGGASRSTQTPEFKPPFAWVADIVLQAEKAGVPLYMKTNLLGDRMREYPKQ